ncbi:hypothetical protein [Halococcus agarilyticus]|uniref:hypothetical protein n=1 Tax=Halococcus agarilyticus TaxID=1232219 RepID=UPI0006779B25|nr:hypothetical protein [Halococcus agarilyticus]
MGDVFAAGPDDYSVEAAPGSFQPVDGVEALYQSGVPGSQQVSERPTVTSMLGSDLSLGQALQQGGESAIVAPASLM